MGKFKQQGPEGKYILSSVSHKTGFSNSKYKNAEIRDLEHLKQMFEAWVMKLWGDENLIGFAVMIRDEQKNQLAYVDNFAMNLYSWIRDCLQPFALEYGLWAWMTSGDYEWGMEWNLEWGLVF